MTQEERQEFLRRMRGPAMLAWTIITSYSLLPWLGLYEPAEAFVRRGFSYPPSAMVTATSVVPTATMARPVQMRGRPA